MAANYAPETDIIVAFVFGETARGLAQVNDRRYKILMLWDYHAVQMKVGPYILELNKTLGARATICGGRSALAEFCQLKEGWASRTAGLRPCFWMTSRGSDIWSTVLGLLRPTPTLQEPRQTGQPPSSRCTVHAQGVKSWGDRFIRVEFCVAYSSHEFVFPLKGSACVDQCVLLTSAEVSRKF